jgi:hypothetical protein
MQQGKTMGRTLYDRERHGTRIILEAERDGSGRFVIAGQDIGEAPMRVFGDSDYEYWYTFDADQETLLASKLRERLADFEGVDVPENAGADVLLGLAFSSGFFETASDLRPFLTDNAIEFAFASYS